ncbi:MAG: DUF1761 family protein [Candidatus Mycalebacterium zealandia]|nr:MAG: DUF1761 family protein [Candidatus Mycalebacterium zealandia]
MNLLRVNFISVIAATVVAFVFGAVWHDEAVFGGIFMEAMGIVEVDATPLKMAVEFAKQFLICLVVAAIAAGLGLKTTEDAFKLSVIVGIGIVGAVIVSQHTWGGLPMVVTAIDVGYSYVSVLIFSLAACLWGK